MFTRSGARFAVAAASTTARSRPFGVAATKHAAKLKMSHVRGPTDTPLIESTLDGFFLQQTKAFSAVEALYAVHEGKRYNFAQLDEEVGKVAAGLSKLGFKKSDRIGVWLPNRTEYFITLLAAARLGVILVTVNPAYRPKELQYALNLVGCKGLIMTPILKTSNYVDILGQVRGQLPNLHHVISVGRPEQPRPPGAILFDELRHCGSINSAPVALDAHDAINIQFTSGTTGSPKAATLTHRNILNNGYFIGRRMNLTSKDKIVIPVPLYHCFGLVLGSLAAMTHGATIIYPSESFDAAASLRAVQQERATALHGVPTMFIAELNHPDFASFDLSSLRTGIMAGSPCPVDTMKKVMTLMHAPEITICYGMTETSPVSFQTSTDEATIERRCETVGTVHPHVEVKIVDEKGQVVPVGTPGELLTRGYSVMQGYWNNPAKTAEAIDQERFMHTGDQAVIDEDGYCRIVGRYSDMIIRGGENIYPREIEEVLFRHPKVMSASVVGVPDPKYGEQVCAWIALKPGNETEDAATIVASIKAHCREELAHFKIPHYVLLKPESAFPMTITGKIQKFIMKDVSVKELGLPKPK